MSDLDSVQLDNTAKVLVIDVKKTCQELGFIVLDPNEFEAARERVEEHGWVLYSEMPDSVEGTKFCEAEGLIVLDQSKDPDPYGNHGIPLLDRLAAMGWPASSPLVLERTDGIREEDLL